MDDLDKQNKCDLPVYAISAPSGVGKTTLIHMLIDKHPDKFMLSVSHTTRSPRGKEVNGLDYHFVSKETFLSLEDSMLEHAEVHGNLYGTSIHELERISSLGRSPLLEIDVQGVAQALKKIPLTTIFVLPPSLQIMWKRLEQRATDDLPTRLKRLSNACGEIKQAGIYSHFLINDNLNDAYKKLESFILEDSSDSLLSSKEGLSYCNTLIDEFYNSSWIEELRSKTNGR